MSPAVILVSFAIKPDCGSEQEVGWSWLLAYLRAGWKVVLIARDAENQKEAFELWQASPEGVSFSGQIDAHFIKAHPVFEWVVSGEIHTGQKFMRLYFHLWQFSLVGLIRSVRVAKSIHHIHHCTFVSDTFIPFAGFLFGTPFVWGPIGGNRRLPLSMYETGAEFLKSWVRDTLRWLSWLVQPVRYRNPGSLKVVAHGLPIQTFLLPRLPNVQITLIPNVYIDDLEIADARPVLEGRGYGPLEGGAFNLYSAGPFISIKNFGISIETLALLRSGFPEVDWRLHLFGDGPLRNALEADVVRRGVGDAVTFHGWVPREIVQAFVKTEAHACIMPTFELGGAVPLEAQLFGVPVFCLAGRSVSYYHKDFLGVGVEGVRRSQFAEALATAIRKFQMTPSARAAGANAIAKHSRSKLTEFIDAIDGKPGAHEGLII